MQASSSHRQWPLVSSLQHIYSTSSLRRSSVSEAERLQQVVYAVGAAQYLHLSQAFNLRPSVMLLLQTDWNSSVFSIFCRLLVLLQLEQFCAVAAVALVAVTFIFINVETPAVGTVQDLDQSQAFGASSVSAPDDVEVSAVFAVETVMYRDLWQISSAVPAPAVVTVPTATTTIPFLDLSLLLSQHCRSTCWLYQRGTLFIGYSN